MASPSPGPWERGFRDTAGELSMWKFGGHSGLVCALHMSNWKSKNLGGVLDGIRIVSHDRESCPTHSGPMFHLDLM